MTKKHFEAFAQRILALHDTVFRCQEDKETAKAQARIAAWLVADVAATDNPRFNREKFMKARGL